MFWLSFLTLTSYSELIDTGESEIFLPSFSALIGPASSCGSRDRALENLPKFFWISGFWPLSRRPIFLFFTFLRSAKKVRNKNIFQNFLSPKKFQKSENFRKYSSGIIYKKFLKFFKNETLPESFSRHFKTKKFFFLKKFFKEILKEKKLRKNFSKFFAQNFFLAKIWSIGFSMVKNPIRPLKTS